MQPGTLLKARDVDNQLTESTRMRPKDADDGLLTTDSSLCLVRRTPIVLEEPGSRIQVCAQIEEPKVPEKKKPRTPSPGHSGDFRMLIEVSPRSSPVKNEPSSRSYLNPVSDENHSTFARGDSVTVEAAVGLVSGSDGDHSMDAVPEDVVCWKSKFVKKYAWMKEEMTKSAAKDVANLLYQWHRIDQGNLQNIHECSWRRDVVEQLLKRVLMGESVMFDDFMRALLDSDEEDIAKALERTTVTTAEKEAFRCLELMALGKGERPNSHETRLRLTPSDHETLVFYLNNATFIDQVNDLMLSGFYFSIREHTNVVHCALDHESRVKALLATMKLCSDNIFDVFCKILETIEMSHVIRKLERRRQAATKRRHTGNLDEVNEPSCSSEVKRQRVDSSVEHRLVTSMQRSSSFLRLHTLKEIDFDVENVNKGSIVIQLCPKSSDSWKKLEESCRSGRIKDLVQVVYSNESIEDLLQEGEYHLQFTIYTLPSPPGPGSQNSPGKKILFHLETDQESSTKTVAVNNARKTEEASKEPQDHHSNPVEDHMNLLVEELEISRDLLKLLKKEGIVSENIKEELDKIGSRSKKLKYLLNLVACHGEKGYQILLKHIEEDNKVLFKELKTRDKVKAIDSQMDHAAKVTSVQKPRSSGGHRSIYSKETFFTGTVVLKVTRTVVSSKKENVDPSQNKDGYKITCPEILNPVCHFKAQDIEAGSKETGAVTMVLEEAWEPVGSRSKPKGREILISKRKKKKDAPSIEEHAQKKQAASEKDPPTRESNTSPDLSPSQSASSEKTGNQSETDDQPDREPDKDDTKKEDMVDEK